MAGSSRQPLAELIPEVDDDPWADLARHALSLSPDQLEAFAATLDDDEIVLLEQAIGDRTATTWRSTPATMGHRLSGGEYQLWPHVELLGRRWVDAFSGSDPHQQWWLPSQYGKTSLLANWGPIWALDRNPKMRLIYVSYDASKAVEEAGKARDLAKEHSADLRFELRPDKRARGMWSTPEGGGLYAVGINGGITGWPADALLLDDLLKGWQQAHSEAARNAVWSIYRSQVRLRVQSNKSPILSCGTRWHEDDPQARMLKLPETDPHADRFTVTRLPAIAETPNPDDPDPILRQPDPLGRAPGEVLAPDRFPMEEVLARRAGLGSYLTAALEQQRPSPEEGDIIKRDWWRYETRIPERFDNALTSWDMKLKDKEAGDFVVGQAWGRTGKDFWCVDSLRGQWDQATTTNAIALMAVRHPEIHAHVIENTGNGPEVMAALRAPLPGYEVSDDVASQLGMTEAERVLVSRLRQRGLGGLIPNNPKGPKPVRARAVVPYIEARDVHLPEDASWVASFVNEHAAFPNGTHDDQVDAMSQALSRLARGVATAKAATDPLPKTPITRQPSTPTASMLGPVRGPTRLRS